MGKIGRYPQTYLTTIRQQNAFLWRTNMRAARIIMWFIAVLMCASSSFAATGSSIRGIVTDGAGKPIRGARVRARSGIKAISRFTQPDGRYEIAVLPGSYEVSVLAFGFAPKTQDKDTAQPGDTNFSLSPKWDATRLLGAEIDQFIPDSADG